MDKIKAIVNKYGNSQGQLVSILQDIQGEDNYISREAIQHVSETLGVPLTQVYSVATFFKAFSLKPRGRHIVNVCLGTACHVRGAARVLSRIEQELSIFNGDTTGDGRFTLESVNCVGTCALGPMVVIDGEYSGQMSTDKVSKLLKKYD